MKHSPLRGSPLAVLAAALLSPFAAQAVVPGAPPSPIAVPAKPPAVVAAPPAPAPDPPAPDPAPAAPPPAAPPAPAPPPAVAPVAPASPPPAVAPASAPPRPRLPWKPKAPPPDPLPEPEIRARVIAPSAQGPWTLRLENEGSRWLRVPADLRLLHVTVESGDSMRRRSDRPIKCALPAALRPEGFPEPSALLLGPGDAYVETFDPRLFCFGKEAKALAGGAVVRATYGWDEARGAKKGEPPFAVEGTTFPAAVQPRKSLVVPTLVLSWLPPAEEEAPEPTPEPDEPPEDKPPATAEAHHGGVAPAEPHKPLPVDENAARLQLTASPFADAMDGRRVTLTLTITNVGHRAATAAIRSRMAGFRVDGPDGTMHCHAPATNHGVPREGFLTLKPGASTALTILVVEACGRELFRRPGLYRVTPTLHLGETGAELGLAAFTGWLRAAEPTLLRIAEGPDPFYKHAPRAVHAPRPEHDETDAP